MTASDPAQILARFDIESEITEIIPFGQGHINNTFRVTVASGKQYLLQSINHHIFRDVEGLMRNVVGVTEFLKQKISENGGDPTRETLTVIPAADGETFVTDESGTPWRIYHFIPNTITYQTVEKEEDFYFSAKAFANFAKLLCDYPAAQLTETIPFFHDTTVRYRNLTEAIRQDKCLRGASVKKEIDFALDRMGKAAMIVDAIADGRIPLRVTHNDTKLNNVLIDKDTGRAICVCDLDTIMPGSILYDFGDAIRFGTNPVAEDDPCWQNAKCDLSLFDAYVRGTMEVMKDDLTETEIDYLPLGAWMMTLECGIRFLTDYLEGDTYFKTSREGQNLDRCHTQFAMVADMERKASEMKTIVDKYR